MLIVLILIAIAIAVIGNILIFKFVQNPKTKIFSQVIIGIITVGIIWAGIGLKTSSKKVDPQLIEEIRILMRDGNLDEAYAMGERLIQDDAQSGFGHFVAGMVSMVRGDYDQGTARLKQALSNGLDKEHEALAYYNLGVAANRQREYDQAIEYLEKSLEINPDLEAAAKTLKSVQNFKVQKKISKYFV